VSRKLQLLLFAGGSAVFAYLVARMGLGKLIADAVQTGWLFVPIMLLYGVVCVCNAAAWWLIMADEPSRPPFWRTWAITVAGFSLNFMTPMVNVGGEPFKIAAVSSWLGVRRAARFVGHDEPPRRRVADAHHPVEQHDGNEQPAGLNGVGDELPQPDARDQVGEDRGAAGEQQ